MKRKITLTKIGSILRRAPVEKTIGITRTFVPRDGLAIAAEVLVSQKKYNKLELLGGTLSTLRKGDIVAGVLGQRKALEGIVGVVPDQLKVGDVIHMLNIGGVMGIAVSWNPDFIEKPVPVKVLGAIEHAGRPLLIGDISMRRAKRLGSRVPIVLIVGSSMGVGKTTAMKGVIRILARAGLRVVAAKLTGVAAQRDLIEMRKAGAVSALSFVDVGFTSTIDREDVVVPAAYGVLNSLAAENPDIMVVELGDGVIGWYGVGRLLRDRGFKKLVRFVIGCAHDLMGAAGLGASLKKVGLRVDLFAGPVTNNSAGTDFIERKMRTRAEDLRHRQEILKEALIKKAIVKRTTTL